MGSGVQYASASQVVVSSWHIESIQPEHLHPFNLYEAQMFMRLSSQNKLSLVLGHQQGAGLGKSLNSY
jgi:hypothetical protein